MNTWLLYLLKVSFCILPFYAVYVLFLRQLTFFRWNRYYLLGSLILSFLIPFMALRVQLPLSKHIAAVPAAVSNGITGGFSSIPDPGHTVAASFNWIAAVQWIYLAGAAVALILFLLSLTQVWQMIWNGQKERAGKCTVIINEKIKVNASFFHFIFLQAGLPPEEKMSVLTHESIHSRKGHSADILTMECLKIICWFHPAIYHYKHLLRRAHEFEVDHEMTRDTDKKDYATLLLGLQSPRHLAIANLFSSSELKERIGMLFAEQSRMSRKGWYLLIIPALLFAGLCCTVKDNDMSVQTSFIQPVSNRTIKGTWNLGTNPIVIINGKEYPPAILTKINPYKVNWSAITLSGNQSEIKKYGQKAKDGLVRLGTSDSSFLISNNYQLEDINIENAVPDSQFLTRITLKDDQGNLYDKVIIQHPGKGSCSVTVNHGGRVAYFLDGQLKTENEIVHLDKAVQDKISSRTAGDPKYFPAALRQEAGDAEAAIELFTAKGLQALSKQLRRDPIR